MCRYTTNQRTRSQTECRILAHPPSLHSQADVWSFGCTALESSTALPPWGKGAIDGMLSAVKHGNPPGNVVVVGLGGLVKGGSNLWRTKKV